MYIKPNFLSAFRSAVFAVFSAGVLFLFPACNGYRSIPPEMMADAPVAAAPWGSGTEAGKSAAAFLEAAGAKKHLFLYFFSPVNNESRFRRIYDAALAKLDDSAKGLSVNVKDPAESMIVQKFRLQQAPMPLVLVVAPNGVVLGGFPKDQIKEEALTNSLSMSSPCFLRCMKSLQEGKIVMLCECRKGDAPRAPKGVLDFARDAKYSAQTRIVTIDTMDPAEQKFVSQLQIDPSAKESSTCILAPPGSVLTTLKGTFGKKFLEEAIQKASSKGGCCPGGAGSAACPPQKPK
jgi:hypothetical protein